MYDFFRAKECAIRRQKDFHLISNSLQRLKQDLIGQAMILEENPFRIASLFGMIR